MPNLTSTDAQQQSILRRRQLAQALQQASMDPLAMPQTPGVKISPLEGIAKLVQAFAANRQNKKLDTEQAALSAQSDKDKLAHALGMANVMLPPAQGTAMTAPVPQMQEAQIPGEDAVPAMQAPEVRQPVQVPPNASQLGQREAVKNAIAHAMASDNPQEARFGEMLVSQMASANAEERQHGYALADALVARQYSSDQAAEKESGENYRLGRTLGNQQDLNQQDNAARMEQVLAQTQSAEKIAGMKQPAVGDPYQTRDVTRNGHVFIQTYAKSDPQAKTISEVDKGPVPAGPQTAAEKQVSDSSEHYIDRISKDFGPVAGTLQKISQGQSLMAANNPQANALVAPTILEALVSGQGTGFRMTEAEIAQINKGQGKIGNFQNWLSQWSLDPSKYTALNADQKKWLNGVLDVAKTKAQAKVNIYNDATDKILAGKSPKDHQTAYRDAQANWAKIDAGQPPASESMKPDRASQFKVIR